MATSIDVLKWQTLTAAINEMKSPNSFLKRLLFSSEITLPTEDIELSTITKDREIAPFVRKNGEGVMVGGHSEKFSTVAAPNIRIKKPFTPSELLFNRRPGTVIFSTGADMQVSAAQAHIARDMKVMADMITNAEEYLCAMAIQGTISYSVADAEVFTITFPKPAACNITLSVFWDDATPANVRILANIHTAKQVFSDQTGLQPTDAICGLEAANQLRSLAESGVLKWTVSNMGQISAGDITFIEQFSDDGVIYLGTIGNVRFWEYGRTASLNGVATSMIRSKYVEFVSRSAASERVMYYGAIADMKTFSGRKFQSKRFSKSWEVEDPSAMMALAASRPLPVTRRPGAHVSMKVISG